MYKNNYIEKRYVNDGTKERRIKIFVRIARVMGDKESGGEGIRSSRCINRKKAVVVKIIIFSVIDF